MKPQALASRKYSNQAFFTQIRPTPWWWDYYNTSGTTPGTGTTKPNIILLYFGCTVKKNMTFLLFLLAVQKLHMRAADSGLAVPQTCADPRDTVLQCLAFQAWWRWVRDVGDVVLL